MRHPRLAPSRPLRPGPARLGRLAVLHAVLLVAFGALSGCASSWEPLDKDGDGYTWVDGDCDDTRATSKPGNAEVCNGLDDDCDGEIDDGVAVDLWADADGDGHGDPTRNQSGCAETDGLVANFDDCDDANPSAAPDLVEVCDGVDQDCDGRIDDEPSDGGTWYTDADADHHGDPNAVVRACEKPADAVTEPTDCDDSDGDVFPDSHATEVPGDGVDQDCDGLDVCTDLDCDGIPDLFIPAERAGAADDLAAETASHLYRGDPGDHPVLFGSLVGPGVAAAAAADFDQDGTIDLALGASAPGESRIAWGSVTGPADAGSASFTTDGVVAIAAAELSGDSLPELILLEGGPSEGSAALTLFHGATGGPDLAHPVHLPAVDPRALVVADLDGDGSDDIAVCDHAGSTIYWNDASLFFTESNQINLPSSGCAGIVAEDLDQDGDIDLVLANSDADSEILWNQGDHFASPDRTALPTRGAWSVTAADLDGDGWSDLVFGAWAGEGIDPAEPVGGDWENLVLAYYSNEGVFTSTDADGLLATGGAYPAVGDLNGDGLLEIVVPGYRSEAGDWSPGSAIWWGDAAGYGTASRTLLDTANSLRVRLLDADQDGDLDLLFTGWFDGGDHDVRPRIYSNEGGAFDEAHLDDLETAGAWASPLWIGQR
jgi:hypothetical protein